MSSRVWSTFQATRSDGSLVKLRIQDLPPTRISDAVDLFVNHFIIEEVLLRTAGVWQNPKAVIEFRSIIRELMKDSTSHTVICCEDDKDGHVGQIVGISLMTLILVGSEDLDPLKKIQVETDEMRLYLKLDEISNLHEQMKKLQISSFYDDIGITVHPEYRQLGIATEFARVRRSACVAYNVAATGGATTSLGTQKIAKKDNWDTVMEYKLDEYGQQYGVTFEEGAVMKLVIWKNPEFKNDEINK